MKDNKTKQFKSFIINHFQQANMNMIYCMKMDVLIWFSSFGRYMIMTGMNIKQVFNKTKTQIE